jgi:hypothetical protein
MEQVRMHGRLFRKVTLSQVQYFCYFAENPGLTVFTPELMAFNPEQEYDQEAGSKMSNIQAMNIEGIFTRDVDRRGDTWSWCFKEKKKPSSPSSESEHPAPSNTIGSRSSKLHQQRKRVPYSTEEEELLIDLKKNQNLPWSEIVKHFPGRKPSTLQVHYSTKLKDRGNGAEPPRRMVARETNTALQVQNHPSLQATAGNALVQRYRLRSNRRSPDRFAPEEGSGQGLSWCVSLVI